MPTDSKHLKPERFSTEPTSESSEKQWKHWKATFVNFMGTITFEAAEAQTKKLELLINYISSAVYEYISECTTYDTAISILENLYVKPVTVIFNRNKLSTRTQQDGESIDMYLQSLQQLSKKCEFKAVDAETYRKEYVRDAFIRGLHSAKIRERLLENANLTLDDAHTQARSIELAHKHNESFNMGTSSTTCSIDTKEDGGGELGAINKPPPKRNDKSHHNKNQSKDNFNNTSSKCWFCAGDRHPRDKCPARGGKCHNCGKPGHWAVCCRSPQSSGDTNLGAMPNLAAIQFYDDTINGSKPNDISQSNGESKVNKNQPLSLMDKSLDHIASIAEGKDLTITVTHNRNSAIKTLLDSGSKLSFISKAAVNAWILFFCRSLLRKTPK